MEDGGDSRSVNWVDFDGDQDLDLYVTNGHSPAQHNFFYENKGNGVFEKRTDLAFTQDGGRSDGASWGDVDNDGTHDLYVANWYNDRNLFYRKGASGYANVEEGDIGQDKGFSESCSWGDLNGDGLLDLIVTNSGNREPEANYVYLNLDGVQFQKQTDHILSQEAKRTRSVNIIDYDGDGDEDVFLPMRRGRPMICSATCWSRPAPSASRR